MKISTNRVARQKWHYSPEQSISALTVTRSMTDQTGFRDCDSILEN